MISLLKNLEERQSKPLSDFEMLTLKNLHIETDPLTRYNEYSDNDSYDKSSEVQPFPSKIFILMLRVITSLYKMNQKSI